MEKYNFLNKSAKGPTRIGQANESVLRTRKKPSDVYKVCKIIRDNLCVSDDRFCKFQRRNVDFSRYSIFFN